MAIKATRRKKGRSRGLARGDVKMSLSLCLKSTIPSTVLIRGYPKNDAERITSAITVNTVFVGFLLFVNGKCLSVRGGGSVYVRQVTVRWRQESGANVALATPHPRFDLIKKQYPTYFHGKVRFSCLKEKNVVWGLMMYDVTVLIKARSKKGVLLDHLVAGRGDLML